MRGAIKPTKTPNTKKNTTIRSVESVEFATHKYLTSFCLIRVPFYGSTPLSTKMAIRDYSAVGQWSWSFRIPVSRSQDTLSSVGTHYVMLMPCSLQERDPSTLYMYALCLPRSHELLDQALKITTRATTISRFL